MPGIFPVITHWSSKQHYLFAIILILQFEETKAQTSEVLALVHVATV